MKIRNLFYVTALTLSAGIANAQNEIPAGYVKATVTLANGNIASGYIRDNIKKSASVIFTDESGNNKKVYEGSDISALTTETATFICLNGDFFKIISSGKLSFIQKQSNASNKASYNGTEAVFNNGTEGKVGDYFIYAGKNLKHLNKKTLEAFINADLMGCTQAIEKAKAINGDIAKLQEAVEIYNTYTVK